MEEEKICIHCGRKVSRGRYSKYTNYERCYVCNEIVCIHCAKLGLCQTHYQMIPEEIKQKIKKYRIWYPLSSIVLLISLIMIFFISALTSPQMLPFRNVIEDYQILFAILFTLILIAPIFLLMYARDRKIKKLVTPIQIQEGIQISRNEEMKK